MHKVIALWTAPEDTEAFEKEYHEVHNPLVPPLPNLESYMTSKVLDGPYYRIAEMTFPSLEALQQAVGSEAGQTLVADARRMASAYGNRLEINISAVD